MWFDASFEVEDAGEAGEELTERQTLKFRNEREKAKIKVCKRDSKTDELVPGAVFNLYTQDDIYSATANCCSAPGRSGGDL